MPVAGVPGAHRRRRVARPRAGRSRRCSGRGRRPYGGAYTRGARSPDGSSGPPRPASSSCPRSTCRGTASPPWPPSPSCATATTAAARSACSQFVDNVLNPGVAATRPFLEAVVRRARRPVPVAVAARRWRRGARRARGRARRRRSATPPSAGSPASAAIGAAFMAEIVELVAHDDGPAGRRVAGGRRVRRAAARATATSSAGSRPPTAGGWPPPATHVVASPAEVYYLDMAADTDWHAPGTSWAGHSSLADVEAFDVTAGWSAAERANLLGIQACVWTEHAPDRPTLERLLFPRLDAIAASAWTPRPPGTTRSRPQMAAKRRRTAPAWARSLLNKERGHPWP